MSRWRAFRQTTLGKTCLCLLILICVGCLVYSVSGFVASDDPASLSRQGLFIDASTGKAFAYTIQIGDRIPVVAPSGGRTGYPAELCYWTREGTMRAEPYPVVVKRYAGKSGPTFCPDCGRLVKAHTAPPAPNQPPPPTQAEYALNQPEGSDAE
jgi:hypothetical protein